jgi:catechol-2,3-dioxygenase
LAQHFRPHLAHLGIFVRDIETLERFYTRVFGLVVTDRGVGSVFKNQLVFLSGARDQHHQLVLSGGRGDWPSTVMQLSFKLETLDQLRAIRSSALAEGATDMISLNHGNAWSIYFNDPEGNRVEVYLDTPFHTPQPCGDPLDLELSDSEILLRTELLVARRCGGMRREDYVAELGKRLEKVDPLS